MAATVGVINGGLMALYVASQKIAVATGGSLSISHSPREASNKDDGAWQAKLEGRLSATASGSFFFRFDTTYSYSYLFGLMIARTAVAVKWDSSNAGNKYYSFSGIITLLEADFPDQESGTISITIESTGAVTETTNT
jgi:hypothetical protein